MLTYSLYALPERFQQRIHNEPNTSCWVWTGRWDKQGYGIIDKKPNRKVHRLCYEMLIGPIPKGLEIDHLCRTPCCVNPIHLEPVTHAENIRRGKWKYWGDR